MTILHTDRALKGIGDFSGPPPNIHFLRVVEIVKAALPLFASSALSSGIENEKGLNSRLARFINNVGDDRQMPYTAQIESMEDEARGDSPATDIGIHLKVDDIAIDPPKITVFEGKRLSSALPEKRRREYVIGHDERGKHVACGGMERFKRAIHGGKFCHAGMIGYLQDGTPENWRDKINAWISDLSSQPFDPAWSEREHLTPQIPDEGVAECSSVVHRAHTDLHLTHLWVDLLQKNVASTDR